MKPIHVFETKNSVSGSNETQKNIKDIVCEHLTTTHIHGLPHIVRTKYLFIKILWMISFLALGVLCTFVIYNSIDEYLQRPTITEIYEFSEPSSLFPAVTICNINPFVTTEAVELIKNNLINAYSNSSYFEDSVLYESLFSAKLSAQLEVSFNESFRGELKKKMGPNLSEFILDCSFNYVDCVESDFTWYYSFEYGNCFTFNAERNSSLTKRSDKPGMKNGLYLEIFTGMKENLSVTKGYGAIVFIHNQTKMPELSENLYLKPGTLIDIRIKKVFKISEPYPYSQCQDLNVFQFDKRFYENFTEKNYHQNDCVELCVREEILKINPRSKDSKCNLRNSKNDTIKCLRTEYINIMSNSSLAKACKEFCPLECNSDYIDFTVSLLGFPSETLCEKYKSIKFIEKHFENRKNITNDEIRKNSLAVNIYFNNLGYTEVRKTAKINFGSLISNIGGILGLCMGMSILSVFQLVDMILEIIFFFKEKK